MSPALRLIFYLITYSISKHFFLFLLLSMKNQLNFNSWHIVENMIKLGTLVWLGINNFISLSFSTDGVKKHFCFCRVSFSRKARRIF